ncbi:MAG: exodeoxyribonuclease III [Spirochaetia bacterium]
MAIILSWNVNGLRSVIAKGALTAVARRQPDVLCLQEVRTREDQVGLVMRTLPHQYFATTRKPGYSGTAVLSRTPGLSWADAMGYTVSDDEGRVVTVEYPTLYVVSVYVPNSQRGLPRLPFRLRWDRSFRTYVGALSAKKPVVFCGDMNVAHEDIDIARPNDNRMNAGFTDRERRSFTRLLGAGFLDSFRVLQGEERECYTWWSLATRARERNIGWRIDYVCISEALRPRLRRAWIMESITGSDHCPVGIELDGEL